MGIFNIKLKTKNGNDIKHKVVFNVYFQLRYVRGLKTTAVYTYRVYYSKEGQSKIKDTGGVFEIKDNTNVISREDLTIKVMLNLIHIMVNIAKEEDLDPDVITFVSTDFDNLNLVWRVLSPIFKRKEIVLEHVKQSRMIEETVDTLKTFVDINPNTNFNYIDPRKDKTRFAKSIAVCLNLNKRIEELQVTKDT